MLKANDVRSLLAGFRFASSVLRLALHAQGWARYNTLECVSITSNGFYKGIEHGFYASSSPIRP